MSNNDFEKGKTEATLMGIAGSIDDLKVSIGAAFGEINRVNARIDGLYNILGGAAVVVIVAFLGLYLK